MPRKKVSWFIQDINFRKNQLCQKKKMKLNTKMPQALKPYYTRELSSYRQSLKDNDLKSAWKHLERAHIIGQRYPFQHSETHWKMFLLGCQMLDLKEIFGQLVRLLFGAPLSFINKIPLGNVGSTRTSMIKPQPLPVDIQRIFKEMES